MRILARETDSIIREHKLSQAAASLAPIMVALLMAIGLGLRLYQAASKSVWLDEAFSIWVARHSPAEILAWLVKVDQHPPLYYLSLSLWIRLFGWWETPARAFSALWGVLTIPVMFAIGRRLGGIGLGLVAALLLTFSPFHVQFAQEMRMYALLSFGAAVALWGLATVIDEPAAREPLGTHLQRAWAALRGGGGRDVPADTASPAGSVEQENTAFLGYTGRVSARRAVHRAARWRLPRWHEVRPDVAWLALAVGCAAAVLTHNTAVFLPAGVSLFLMGYIFHNRLHRDPFARNALLTMGFFVLLWSPWFPVVVYQTVRVIRRFWIPAPTWKTVLGTFHTFHSAFLPDQVPLRWLWDLVFFALALLGVIHWLRRPGERWKALMLVTLFLTPIAGELLFSLRRPIFYSRTLIWATLPYYLLIASGIIALRFIPYQTTALIILLTLNVLSLNHFYVSYQKEGWDKAAAYVARHARPGDVILFNATWVQIPFDYYFQRYNRPIAEHGVPVDLFDRGELEPPMTEADVPRLQRLIREHDRVWLIYSHDWYTDPKKIIPRVLDRELKRVREQRFVGIRIVLYSAR
jgi:4-amino-4-deoxy-L-arabinose transferase-like glycosyltransferase